jgi:hypothetical protein
MGNTGNGEGAGETVGVEVGCVEDKVVRGEESITYEDDVISFVN